MKIFLLILTILSIGAHFNATAQTKKFRWQTLICEFEGTYDARKYTLNQLENTARLIDNVGLPLDTDATADKYADIEKLSVEALEREYNQKLTDLKKLAIVSTPYFEDLRQRKIRELEQAYQLKRVTMLAYRNPAALKEHRAAETCVAKYADPLIKGGDDLLNVWRQVNEHSRRQNADPGRLERIFNEQLASPARFEFARTEVMTFGWWNCANEFIEYVEDHDTSQKNFKKLFTRVRTIGCDEP